MKKRFALLLTMVVMAAALALPASTAAASNKTWSIIKNSCTLRGGAFGYGSAKLKVRLDERGWSGTGQFRAFAWLEEKRGNRWYDVYDYADTYSNFFGDDSYSWFWKTTRTYQFGSNAAVYYHRIVILAQWLSDSGHVIGEKRINGRAC